MRVTLCFLVAFGLNCVVGLTINDHMFYELRGKLTVPSAGISETYTVWYDGVSRRARVDYYDGMDKLYRKYDKATKRYVYTKIHPATTGRRDRVVTSCAVMNVTSELYSTDRSSYLPNKNFSFVKKETLEGFETERWEYERTLDSSRNVVEVYTMWMRPAADRKMGIIPYRFIYTIREKIVNLTKKRLFDWYQHDYLSFEAVKPEESDLQVPLGLKCTPKKVTENEPVDPLMELVNPSVEHSRISLAFDKFKVQHNKDYSSKEEHKNRFEIFKNTMRYINSFNRQHKSYTLGINHFADRTDEELSALMGTRVPGGWVEDQGVNDDDEDDDDVEDDNEIENDLNKELDWRKHGAITEVKDQTLLCGACYAFTAAAAIESGAYVHRGCEGLEEASEQAIIDCSWEYHNSGCGGGWLSDALDWVKLHGLPLKKEYGPYLGAEGTCHISEMKNLLTISSYERVPKNKKRIKKALQKKGPLLAAINARPKTFQYYIGGIYEDTECSNVPTDVTHGLAVIGYGSEDGQQYWILKNSFGKGWGEDGYMRIAVKNNVCGVKNWLFSVEFAGQTNVAMCYSDLFQ